MSSTAHPFATGGGGTLFEYKVATLLAADLIRSRFTEHGGVVAALELQVGPLGFDDLQVSLELLDGGHRTMHTQCRHMQRFTGTDANFIGLLLHAGSAVQSDEASFASGTRRLAIIVDRASPGYASMAALCELARAVNGFARFVSAVEAHAGKIAGRWSHCCQATEGTDPAVLYRVLAALEIRAVEVRTPVSRDSVELINRLAEAWDPANQQGAVNLANALFKLLTETGPVAGAIDIRSLQSQLRSWLPTAIGANTRRARLGRRRDAGHQRVALTLRAIGLDDNEASALAIGVITARPNTAPRKGITVVTGPMGVGKTAELERLHRQALDRALDDTTAPVPVLLHAREVATGSLERVVREQTDGLGDPSRIGVSLIIDGLDEAGIRISDLTARVATLVAAWPNSTVVMASRPESSGPGLFTEVLEPLSQEEAAELMAAIDPHIDRWPAWREELTEVLRRPLFAIRYALDRRTGNAAGTREAQLVDSVGRHAIDDLGDTADAAFDLLVRLACRIVDSGGQPADLRGLEATPAQIAQITRSRIVHVADGRASFQLSALTEWFAASALLRDHNMLESSLSGPLRTHRWRYAFVQALLQGSAEGVDRVMTTLLARAPATAGWVHHQAQAPYRQDRTTPLAATAIEAGVRVRRAARAWIEPWPRLVDSWTLNGEMPTLGVAMNGAYLVTAWRRSVGDVSDPVVPLPPYVRPLKPLDRVWTGLRAGQPQTGELWPWDWTFGQVQRQVDAWIANRDLLAEIEVCWPELAWDYAHQIVGRSPDVQSKPIFRTDLEAAITSVRAQFPDGNVHVHSYRGGWKIAGAESFLEDLYRLDIQEIASPWPPANTKGSWTWEWWTADQLVNRLNLATKAGLDAYEALVRRHLPAMAAELNTYQLLPARIVGALVPGGPGEGFESQPEYSWYLEPLSAGSSNEAHWRISNTHEWADRSEWERQVGVVRSLRGDVADRLRWLSGGEPEILSSTPAGSFALALLARDLNAFEWTSGLSRHDINSTSTRPRYR